MLPQINCQASPAMENTQAGVTFASLTPDSGTAGASFHNIAVSGSGFSAVNNLQFDNGAGGLAQYDFSVDSDTSITMGPALGDVYPAAGSYTLFYSEDNGITWITTGLILTVNA